MSIIHQHDKRSGITYAYESHSYWDKELKKKRAKRRLIGRIDPTTGDIIPTDGRGRKDKSKETKEVEPDYKKLYLQLRKQCQSKEILIEALKKEIKELKE